MMMDENERPDALWFEVDHSSPGHAHTRLSGRCNPRATVQDVEKRFFHPYFGGRDAGVSGDGKFWVTVHTD